MRRVVAADLKVHFQDGSVGGHLEKNTIRIVQRTICLSTATLDARV
jgi:hypothetical protein